MMRMLKNLRDFLDEEALKFLPGNLITGQFIILRENIKNKEGLHQQVLHVFDQGGTWVGTIENPDWIPSSK